MKSSSLVSSYMELKLRDELSQAGALTMSSSSYEELELERLYRLRLGERDLDLAAPPCLRAGGETDRLQAAMTRGISVNKSARIDYTLLRYATTTILRLYFFNDYDYFRLFLLFLIFV